MNLAPETEVIKMQLQEVVQTGGGGSDEIWLPSVSEEGVISWTKSASSTAPTERNIKGADGQDGQDGADGLGIKSVNVNASNHLIVTYDDDTPEDAGEIDVSVPIDDTTPASDKVYSSEKVATIASSKFDASYAQIIPGGTNLYDYSNAKLNWKPNSTGASTYDDGTVTAGMTTSNLWSCTKGEKFKLNYQVISFCTYFRAFYYTDAYYWKGAESAITFDYDGNYYITVPNNDAYKYVCIVANGNNWSNLIVTRYDEWGGDKLVFDKLYFNDNNVAMAKDRLGFVNDMLYGKKWAVAGDSFTAGDFTGITTPTIPSGKYAGQKAVYPYLIGNKFNMTIQDLSKGGRTLALPSGESSSYNSFTNHYQSVAADADYLTIYLGINDSHNSATIPLGTISDNTTASFYGAWNVILTWLIENRPNLKIGIIVSNGCDSDDYRTATIAIAQKYGIPYIDMNGDKQTPCMMRSTNTSIASAVRTQRTANWRVSESNGHPNAACHAFEATFIEDFLRSL